MHILENCYKPRLGGKKKEESSNCMLFWETKEAD
jgi:hypothetical protein